MPPHHLPPPLTPAQRSELSSIAFDCEAMEDYLSTYKTELYDGTLSILNQKRELELDTEVLRAQNSFDTAEHARDFASSAEET